MAKALDAYNKANVAVQCELDGTCGTGTPGVGDRYLLKRQAFDLAADELTRARAAAANTREQLDRAHDNLSRAESDLLNDSARLRTAKTDVEQEGSHNVVLVQFRTLITTPPFVLVIFLAGVSVMILVLRKSRSSSDREAGSGELP